jgi:hypothetical protein
MTDTTPPPPPPPLHSPILERQRAMTGDETSSDTFVNLLLNYYENLTSTSFDFLRPGLRGLEGKKLIFDEDELESKDVKKIIEDSEESDFNDNKQAIIYSSITTESIRPYLLSNKEAGVARLKEIIRTIQSLNGDLVTKLLEDIKSSENKEIMQKIIKRLKKAIPTINKAIEEFESGIPSKINAGSNYDTGMDAPNDAYEKKYLKYKHKYLELKKNLKK